MDPFHVQRAVPVTPASPLLADEATCDLGPPPAPLTLMDAVERALCHDPDTRTAWAQIEVKASAVGVSRAAYLPTLSANGQYVHDDEVTNVRGHASLSSAYAAQVHSESLSLGWVLYDFGSRRAALDSAKAQLLAAQANDNAVLQQVFGQAAKAYYDAQAAQSQLHADEAVVEDAQTSLASVQARVEHGTAPNTELYQAQTAYQQAVLTQSKDRGNALAALGALADAMALSPDTPVTLAPVAEPVLPDHAFEGGVSQLIDEARRTHPAVRAAEAQWQAAEAQVRETRAQGRPSVKLVSEYSRNNQPVQLGLGLPHFPATGHDGYVGIEVSIPLFTGFTTTYQVRQAEAQADVQNIAVDQVRQQVALAVWRSYQTLQTATANLGTSQELQQVAMAAWESAQRRYRTGVGTVLELLGTQTALAQARQQRVQALTDWRYDRLALGAALGQLTLTEASNR